MAVQPNPAKNTDNNAGAALMLGVFLCAGLLGLGFILAKAAVDVKEYERSVTVKGLAEREMSADVVIWPIQFTEASNDLGALYGALDDSTNKIKSFLLTNHIAGEDISVSAPAITDFLFLSLRCRKLQPHTMWRKLSPWGVNPSLR